MTANLGILIPIAAILGGFVFASISAWAGERTREREVFYRYELYKKLAEVPSEQARAVMDLEREEQGRTDERERARQVTGGLITGLVGIGLMAMFALITPGNIWSIGLIPLLVGVALLLNASFFTSRRRAAAASAPSAPHLS
jgi:hypothetical protein